MLDIPTWARVAIAIIGAIALVVSVAAAIRHKPDGTERMEP